MIAASRELRDRRRSELPKQLTNNVKELNKHKLKKIGLVLNPVKNGMPWSEYELDFATGVRKGSKRDVQEIFNAACEQERAQPMSAAAEKSTKEEAEDPDLTDVEEWEPSAKQMALRKATREKAEASRRGLRDAQSEPAGKSTNVTSASEFTPDEEWKTSAKVALGNVAEEKDQRALATSRPATQAAQSQPAITLQPPPPSSSAPELPSQSQPDLLHLVPSSSAPQLSCRSQPARDPSPPSSSAPQPSSRISSLLSPMYISPVLPLSTVSTIGPSLLQPLSTLPASALLRANLAGEESATSNEKGNAGQTRMTKGEEKQESKMSLTEDSEGAVVGEKRKRGPEKKDSIQGGDDGDDDDDDNGDNADASSNKRQKVTGQPPKVHQDENVTHPFVNVELGHHMRFPY